MKRRFFLCTSMLAVVTGTLLLSSCSTPETRISEHPDLYQSLSHKNQALVSQGQIRIGMSRTAVWLAWVRLIERFWATWAEAPPRPGCTFITRRIIRHTGRGHHGVILGIPFTIHSIIRTFPPSIPYPTKVVTFARGRVASFQYVASQ